MCLGLTLVMIFIADKDQVKTFIRRNVKTSCADLEELKIKASHLVKGHGGKRGASTMTAVLSSLVEDFADDDDQVRNVRKTFNNIKSIDEFAVSHELGFFQKLSGGEQEPVFFFLS